MGGILEGKRILVTGGTGSIGSALVEKILTDENGEVKSIAVFSRDEAKQYEMRKSMPDQRLQFRIGDIRNYDSVLRVMHGIDIVFHCAALKHVPACEDNPDEAIQINVNGARNIVRAIHEHALPIESVVGCSTDKACNPISVMGLTKLLQEKIFIKANGGRTKFILCRFGNIIGTRGSVIPLFQEQIAKGGPVTITDPSMTRFLMRKKDAVTLMLAATAWRLGNILVPVMPAVFIAELARLMIGNLPIKIQIIGMRPGERLHESIITENERQMTWKSGNDQYCSVARGNLDLPEHAMLDAELFISNSDRNLMHVDALRALLIEEGVIAA